jgi:hypothetical protein
VASIVANAVRDDVDIDAVELARVVGAGSGGVAPAADADFGAVVHPLVVLVRREGDWHDVVIDDERALEEENSDVVDESSRVVVRVATEGIDLNTKSKIVHNEIEKRSEKEFLFRDKLRSENNALLMRFSKAMRKYLNKFGKKLR